ESGVGMFVHDVSSNPEGDPLWHPSRDSGARNPPLLSDGRVSRPEARFQCVRAKDADVLPAQSLPAVRAVGHRLGLVAAVEVIDKRMVGIRRLVPALAI